MTPIIIFVTYTAKTGTREKFVNEIFSGNLLETIRNEEGCISYDYYYPVQEKDSITLIEKWETQEHQKCHLQQPHMEELRKIKERYITDTKVEIINTAEL